MTTKELLVLQLIVIAIGLPQAKPVSVKTNIGEINGLVEDVTFLQTTSKLHKFLGIPFAEPPVGKLRFQKPVPKSPLQKPLDAFKHSNACMQLDLGFFEFDKITHDEDCLYLNIYAPERESSAQLLPVMVWIYGGGYTIGFADQYIGDHLATHGNVIVVTLNYRLSVWGFFTTGDTAAPGNYGLWDQHLAIQWVHDNIAAFGGDINRITIFGESAGSASVMLQALYPGNKGLVQRVIGQSGSVGNFWGSNKENAKYGKRLGELVGCETDNSEALVDCLREVAADQFVEILSNATHGFLTFPFPFLPTHDGDFVAMDFKYTFDNDGDIPNEVANVFSSLDIMSGVNAGEGSVGLTRYLGFNDVENFLPNKTFFEETLVPLMVKTVFGENVPEVVKDFVIAEYTNWETPEDFINIREEYISMWGDLAFNADLYKTMETHAKLSTNQHTYMYIFDTETDFKNPLAPISWFKKLAHGEDLAFVFGFKNSEQLGAKWHVTPSRWAELLSADIMTIWANFAKTGNPNSPDDLGLDWIPYTRKHQHYLQISRDMTSSNVKQRGDTKRAHFWAKLLPELIKAASCGESKYSERLNQDTCEKGEHCSP